MGGKLSMSTKPLRTAVLLLFVAIGLTIALGVGGTYSDQLIALSQPKTVPEATDLAASSAVDTASVDTVNRSVAESDPSAEIAIAPSPPLVATASLPQPVDSPFANNPTPRIISADHTPPFSAVLADAPYGVRGIPIRRTGNGSRPLYDADHHAPRLGYEELPPPPHLAFEEEVAVAMVERWTIENVDASPVTLKPMIEIIGDAAPPHGSFPLDRRTSVDSTDQQTIIVGPPRHAEHPPLVTIEQPTPVVVPPQPSPELEALRVEVAALKDELSRASANGISQEREEIARLRELLHELQSLRNLTDLHEEIRGLATRQHELEQELQRKAETPPIIPPQYYPPPIPAEPIAPVPVSLPEPVAPESPVITAPPAPPVTKVEEPPAVLLEHITGSAKSGRFNLFCTAATPQLVLAELGAIGEFNGIVGPGVPELISLTLRNVTVEEATAGLARALGSEFIEEDEFRLLLPAEVVAARKLQQQRDAEQPEPAPRPIAKVITLNHIAAVDVEPLLRPLLTPGIGNVGIKTTSVEKTTANGPTPQTALVLFDTTEAIARMETLVAELDLPPSEIEIEAMIITVRHDQSNTGGLLPLMRRLCREQAFADAAMQIHPQQCLPPMADSTGYNGDVSCLEDVSMETSALACGRFHESPRQMLKRLQELVETDVNATPTIRVLNGRSAQLEIGAQVGYRAAATWRPFGQVSSQQVDFLEEMTRLCVQPCIQPDGSIRMHVHPEMTHVIIDPKTDLPRQLVASASTEVSIPDGCTVMIAGLARRNVDLQLSRTGVIGSLRDRFGKPLTETVCEEVMILLTPRLSSCSTVTMHPSTPSEPHALTPPLVTEQIEVPPAPDAAPTDDLTPSNNATSTPTATGPYRVLLDDPQDSSSPAPVQSQRGDIAPPPPVYHQPLPSLGHRSARAARRSTTLKPSHRIVHQPSQPRSIPQPLPIPLPEGEPIKSASHSIDPTKTGPELPDAYYYPGSAATR